MYYFLHSITSIYLLLPVDLKCNIFLQLQCKGFLVLYIVLYSCMRFVKLLFSFETVLRCSLSLKWISNKIVQLGKIFYKVTYSPLNLSSLLGNEIDEKQFYRQFFFSYATFSKRNSTLHIIYKKF